MNLSEESASARFGDRSRTIIIFWWDERVVTCKFYGGEVCDTGRDSSSLGVAGLVILVKGNSSIGCWYQPSVVTPRSQPPCIQAVHHVFPI